MASAGTVRRDRLFRRPSLSMDPRNEHVRPWVGSGDFAKS